jgi:hypothetical protein
LKPAEESKSENTNENNNNVKGNKNIEINPGEIF